MTGQLSFMDWMPEAVPELEKRALASKKTMEQVADEELSTFLWNNARTGVRGYIASGGRSVDFVKSAYGVEGGSVNGGQMHYLGDHVTAVIGEERCRLTWKQYVNYLVEYSAREKGWSRK